MLRALTTERASQPRRISELCVAMLGITGAGVSMVTSAGHHSIVCATDGVAARIEDLQLTLGEGPCVDAVRTGMPILVRDLDEPDDVAVERWPAFMEGAAKAGVRAVFAFPLHIGAIRVGALDLYRDRAGELDRDRLRGAFMAADATALALLHLDLDDLDHTTGTDDGARPATQQLQVHQATGMVQVQLNVTTEQAFLMLRARAFSTGRPLVDVAIDVVERRLRFSTEDQ